MEKLSLPLISSVKILQNCVGRMLWISYFPGSWNDTNLSCKRPCVSRSEYGIKWTMMIRREALAVSAPPWLVSLKWHLAWSVLYLASLPPCLVCSCPIPCLEVPILPSFFTLTPCNIYIHYTPYTLACWACYPIPPRAYPSIPMVFRIASIFYTLYSIPSYPCLLGLSYPAIHMI